MKKLAVSATVLALLVSGCVGYPIAPYDGGGDRGHERSHDRERDRDRDRDGIPNRVDRDRDGDGVPNSQDRRPNNPNRY